MNIKITHLNISGLELFEDNESFLHELTNEEIGVIEGGLQQNFLVSLMTQTQVIRTYSQIILFETNLVMPDNFRTALIENLSTIKKIKI